MSAVQFNHQINWNDEFVRRIPQKKHPLIQARVNQVRREDIMALTASMERDDWAAERPLIDPNMPFVALVAYQTKAIADVQFSTLLDFWAAVGRYGAKEIRTLSLKNTDGALVAIRAFNPTTVSKLGPRLTEFSARVVQRGPSSECHFFIVNAPVEPKKSGFPRVCEYHSFSDFFLWSKGESDRLLHNVYGPLGNVLSKSSKTKSGDRSFITR